ncbi:MAG: F0F1 ATP synthase subunit epsilon [Rhizobiales bacterium]|nr:F0F1 ATP synthase subunit epsilon [Hyphomicrobiales bacterium]
MATFNFDLVSPDRLVFSDAVDQVDVPGTEGDFGVLAGHAPYVATLKPGIVVVHLGGEQRRMVVIGGFAEVSAKGLTILADMATPIEDFDGAHLATEIKNTEEDAADAQDGRTKDKLEHRLSQLRALQAAVVA